MAAESAVLGNVRLQKQTTWFLPREHGATAMLFTPIVCAAILSRAWHWSELATLTAAVAAAAAYGSLGVTDFRAFKHFALIGGAGMLQGIDRPMHQRVLLVEGWRHGDQEGIG